MPDFDVAILGGGAAGLMCAIEAGKRGRRVLVLEHMAEVGKKILISGGGRCNFTNRDVRPENYLSQNPHFCKSALARYRPEDFIALVEQHGIGYHEKKLGQLFCDHSARQIVDMLLKECQQAGVKILTGQAIHRVEKSEYFTLYGPSESIQVESLVLATGGLSIPQMGATDFSHRVARQFGLRMTPLRPALVPLSYSATDKQRFSDLSGIALDTLVSLPDITFRESALLAHFGLSGPAILQISSYWQPGQVVTINLLPEMQLLDWLQQQKRRGNKQLLSNLLADYLPKRLVQRWCEQYASLQPLSHYGDRELEQIAEHFQYWHFLPAGTEGYRKAEVTAGGIDTRDLSSQTMAARKVPGLYCIGEGVDVTGWLGGYNFQWAWASGYAAGQTV